MSKRKYPPAIERFMAKIIKKPNGCWIWTGSLRSAWGYGQFRGSDGRVTTIHKFSFEHHKGPIPTGKKVCHTCDTPACGAPAHLFLGTHKENMDDMRRKNRQNDFGRKGPGLKIKRYKRNSVALFAGATVNTDLVKE